MERAHVARMRQLRALLALSIVTGCAQQSGPSPYDGDFPTSGNTRAGAPPNSSLPNDNKADAVYPAKFFLDKQSPVTNQGHRGDCTIFAATALVEELYIAAGMANPDFSEQYLQWAVKTQQHAFPNSEGSSPDQNLQAVVKFGTVEEGVWPYEISPWTAANDPACQGKDGEPTRCYTNGEPPAAAATATKYKLPSVQYLNTNSIKAHMTAKKTGVVIAIDFFFQAWNHRLSKLPINADLWAQGAVTYPNAKDKELSIAEHEGHGILLVGWDDNLEFPMRDEKGAFITDANGNQMKEKGFWIFKNSWDTWSFGAHNPYAPGYGFISYRYVDEYASAVSAEVPTLTTDPCVTDPQSCAGNMTHDYAATPALAIPDNDPTGVTSTITTTDAGNVATVKVTTDITHTYRGDLKVTLSHGGVTQVVFNNEGGAQHDLKQAFAVTGFEATTLGGDWVLKVEDDAAQDTGTFAAWQLEVVTK